MHKPQRYSEHLEVVNGDLTRTVTAYYKDLSLDILRECEDGKSYCRNLYNTVYGGYCVAFPGERFSYSYSYYGNEIATLEEWRELKRPANIAASHCPAEWQKNIIISKYPDFKYVLKKCSLTLAQIIRILPIWKEHKEVELLLASGFSKIAYNKSFYRYSEKKRKEIIRFLCQNRKNTYFKSMNLSAVLLCMKHNLTSYQVRKYSSFVRHSGVGTMKYETYLYLKKQYKKFYQEEHPEVDLDTSAFTLRNMYVDYMRLLDRTEHSKKEEYWIHPSNLRIAHQKVLEEVNEINRAIERQKWSEKEEALSKICSRFSPYFANYNGYSIFIASDADTWINQAEELHQCIVRCHYDQEMIEGRSFIFFIQKDGRPVATAQVFKDKSIGQFYADEGAGVPALCRPSKEVQRMFEDWLETVPRKVFNPPKKKEKEIA